MGVLGGVLGGGDTGGGGGGGGGAKTDKALGQDCGPLRVCNPIDYPYLVA